MLNLRTFSRVAALLVGCALLTGADYLGRVKIEKSQNFMGTSFQITVFESDLSQENLARTVEQTFALIGDLDGKLSSFKESSVIARINQTAPGQIFKLDDDTLYVLSMALDVARMSGGAFDITVWPLKKLWMQAKEKSEPSGEIAVKAALSQVGYSAISLDPITKNLTLKKPGIQIDLGGIGKGYALDRAANFLSEHGVRSAIINGGGNLKFIGLSQEGTSWRVGIEHPRKVDAYAAVLELPESVSVSTSGDYEDFFIYKGKRYSHIFDPRTGAQPDNHIVSVTVIAKNATLADALSTAFFVMGPEKGFPMIESFKDEKVDALCIEEGADGKLNLSASEGIQASLKDITL